MDVAVRAEARARDAHCGQSDKSGHPYVEHLARVAAQVAEDSELEAVAWLHDVLEDTAVTSEELRGEFPGAVVTAVEVLTRRAVESDEVYYQRVAGNSLALRVKHADLADNSDAARLDQLDKSTRERLQAKYARARSLLARAPGV